MTAWPPITRDDLRSAAKSAGFDTTFPLLVRRLISETGASVTELDMPGGSGTAAGGFDGVVSADQNTTFVPIGTSVWELSVGGGQTKADEDYDKRTAAPSGLPTQDVTYVQVILEPWTKARAWETGRNRDRIWKRVLAYNLDRVHAWLDQAPATTAWLAERLGKAMPGVRPLTAWWEETWLPSTTTPLDASIVLAGRESAAASLQGQLSTGQRLVTLGGDLRLEEALAFVAASIQQDKGPDGVARAVRTLLVSYSGSLAQLIGQTGPLVLMLSSVDLAAAVPSQHPHQLLVTTPHGVTGTVDVPPVNSEAVESQFEAAGFPRERARSLGTLARRSLLGLRRALAVNPVLLTPAWATAPDVVRRRMLLIGTWDGASEEDRRIVAECIGRPYIEVQDAALALAAAGEAPFIGRVDERWHLLSPEDSWTLLSGHLTRDDLDAFRSAALEVLGESDPALEMDEDERWAAHIRGVRRKFSGTLRAGLARSLALLGSIEGGGIRVGNITGPEWAAKITWELLTKANGDNSYHLWSSLQDVLTLLAEAAPDVFLRATSDGLAGQRLHGKMFQDGVRG